MRCLKSILFFRMLANEGEIMSDLALLNDGVLDLNRVESLEELKTLALECRRCCLRSGCSGVVFGEGSLRARLMLIGEGPGADEDRLGRPFVGKAGQLLDRMLSAIGLERFQHTYIANVVKCRPPGNRTPGFDEARACLPWLVKQILLISPAIIILLGSTAVKNLIDPQASITAMRGQWLTSRSGIKIMPTFHPAALLRDPAKKRPVWEDLQKVRDLYNASDI
jgi:DNA polymerase